jgi:hypothetical protein
MYSQYFDNEPSCQNEPCIEKEPTCQGMFDDDCVITYLSSKRPINHKYELQYKEKMCTTFILSNINTGIDIYDLRNIEEIPEQQVTCLVIINGLSEKIYINKKELKLIKK